MSSLIILDVCLASFFVALGMEQRVLHVVGMYSVNEQLHHVEEQFPLHVNVSASNKHNIHYELSSVLSLRCVWNN